MLDVDPAILVVFVPLGLVAHGTKIDLRRYDRASGVVCSLPLSGRASVGAMSRSIVLS